MADRKIVVRLIADVKDFKRSMAEAADASQKTNAQFDAHGKRIHTTAGRMVRSAEVNREAWNTAGAAMTAFGLAGVSALGVTAKAAVDWESAWAGVRKTVDGTHEEMAQLEKDLRALALELPASAEEIAGVAEAAGQLGVARENIVDFTRTMINLGETTNLTADEAATSLAQLMNVMQTAPGDVDRLGAAVVALGNDGASTERDIVQMAQRIAGAGKVIGLTEGETLGLANALASVGIEAEAGGSAVSKIMIDIAQDVSRGGESLQEWASIAGMSADEFAAKWKSKPAEALSDFIEGLGRLNAQGGDVFGTLEKLGQTDVRVTRALLGMANSGDLLRESLELGNQAWSENAALVAEAEKRYDTAEAKMQIARNAMNEAAITIGEDLLPALASTAEAVAAVAGWFAQLPDPVRRAAVGMGGIASVAALAAGGFLLLFPRIMDTYKALKQLQAINPGAASTLTSLTRLGAASAAALAGFTALTAAMNAIPPAGRRAAASLAETTQALLDMEEAGGNLEGIFDFSDDVFGLTGNVDSLADAARRLTNPSLMDRVHDFGGTIRGLFGQGDTSRTRTIDQIEAIGQSLALLVQQGHGERAAKQFEMLAAQWVAGGGAVDDLRALMPAYTDALADANSEQRIAAKSYGDTSNALTIYNEALTESIRLHREASGVALSEWDAQTRYAEAVDTATDALYDQNGVLIEANRTLDANTEAGRANRDALALLVDRTWDLVESSAAAGMTTGELQLRMLESRDAFIETATQMGLTREEAEDLADQMGLIPQAVVVPFSTPGLAEAIAQVQALNSATAKASGVRYVVSGHSTGGGLTFAKGGPVYGPGTTTSDSIAAWLSNREYVQSARAHEFWGTAAMNAMNSLDVGGVIQAISAKGFATGGAVGSTFGPPPAPIVLTAPSSSEAQDLTSFAQLVAQEIRALTRAETMGALDSTSRSTQLAGRMA